MRKCEGALLILLIALFQAAAVQPAWGQVPGGGANRQPCPPGYVAQGSNCVLAISLAPAGEAFPQPAAGVAPPAADSGAYLGCFADTKARDLPAGFMSAGNMTPELCENHCRAEGFSYAGAQYGSQCFCGNSYGRYGQLPAGRCNVPCKGNPGEKCGGSWANNVYRVAAAPRYPVRRRVEEPVRPVAPRPVVRVERRETSGAYLGCFADTKARDLPAGFMSARNLTPGLCEEHCRAEGFSYAGTQYGSQCFCGNSYGRYGQLPAGRCNVPCAGNRGEECGGAWANSLYRVSAAPVRREVAPVRREGVVPRPAAPVTLSRGRPVAYLGCFADAQSRDLPAAFMSAGNMTPELCENHCRAEGFSYAGTQYGSQCFCGNSYGRYGQLPAGRCNAACAGNPGDKCGGSWANSLYRVAAPVSAQEEPYGRGAGTLPDVMRGAACPPGREKQSGLCYVPCRPGYVGRGPVCSPGSAGPQAVPTGGGGTVTHSYVPTPTPVVPSVAHEEEEFYWKNSYPRGAGTPVKLVCPSGYVNDASLCYPPCRSGYDGAGPRCWQHKAGKPYSRGAGTFPKPFTEQCPDGKINITGLCYKPCRKGYHGVPGMPYLCKENGNLSYSRGVGHVLQRSCAPGQSASGLFCYPGCRSGFHGEGPVCWGETPRGYVDCGAGFAESSGICAKVVADQTSSVLGLAVNFVPGGEAAGEAARAGKAGAHAEEVFRALEPMMGSLRNFAKEAKGSKGGGTGGLVGAWRRLSPAQQERIRESVDTADSTYKTYNATQAGRAMASGVTNPIDLLRNAAAIASPLDGTGVLDVVAAYAWPIYGIRY